MSEIIKPKNFNLHNYRAIVFDCDGVLVEMPEGHYEALNKALKLFGFTINPEDHIQKYNGLPTKQKLKMMSEVDGLPEGLHSVISEQKKIYTKHEITKRCKPEHSKLLLLTKLKELNIKIACCSNAIQESVEEMLTSAGLIHYFDLVLGNDVGFKPKPAPDIYLAAMKKLNLVPKDCLIIEDAEHGYQAAIASGADVIRVKNSKDVCLSLFL